MLTLELGPLSLPLERVVLILSLVVALTVAGLIGRNKKVSASGLLANLFITGLLAARVSFVLRYYEEYQHSWLSMIDIRDGGFDIWAGVITALLLALYYIWRQPKQRKGIVIGLSAGVMVYGLTQFGLWAIKDTSQMLPRTIVFNEQGQSLDLTEVETSKPRVINLWATWCPPCHREMPVLENAQLNNPEVGFVFVNQGEHQQTIDSYLEEESLTIENVLADPKTMLGSLIGSRALPTTLFVDAQGRLVDAHLGELSRATLKAKLDRLTQKTSKDSEENSL